MKSIFFGFGLCLFLAGCGPDAKTINAQMQKHHDCANRALKKFNTAIDQCIEKFGSFGTSYSACSESAGDTFTQERLNCAKLPE